jgi:hypothetical protein
VAFEVASFATSIHSWDCDVFAICSILYKLQANSAQSKHQFPLLSLDFATLVDFYCILHLQMRATACYSGGFLWSTINTITRGNRRRRVVALGRCGAGGVAFGFGFQNLQLQVYVVTTHLETPLVDVSYHL